MLYKTRKDISAILSLLSVVIALVATAIVVYFADNSFSDMFGVYSDELDELGTLPFMFLSALLAAVSATWSIALSRSLAASRERRKVFLIYSRKDLEHAARLATHLKDLNYSLSFFEDEVTVGQLRKHTILKSLEESTAALVLISKNFGHDSFAQKELDIALETLQEPVKSFSPVIPVRLDETPVPKKLEHIHWVDLFNEEGMENLDRGLKRILKN